MLKLTSANQSNIKELHINPRQIASMYRDESQNVTVIHFFAGNKMEVQETPEDILKTLSTH